jgi:heme/copper-type cytochrome/quinol oxidase subunit 2
MQKPQPSHKLREFISVSWGCSPTYGVLPRSGARAEIHNSQVMVMMMVIMMMVFVVMMFVIAI